MALGVGIGVAIVAIKTEGNSILPTIASWIVMLLLSILAFHIARAITPRAVLQRTRAFFLDTRH